MVSLCGDFTLRHCTTLRAQEHPQLQPLILRKFRIEGDVELAQQLVFESSGIQRARDLAAQHAQLAADAVSHLLDPALAWFLFVMLKHTTIGQGTHDVCMLCR